MEGETSRSKSHVNFGYEVEPENGIKDNLDSNYDNLSTPSSSDCGSEPEWNNSIGVKGDLFYVENSFGSDISKLSTVENNSVRRRDECPVTYEDKSFSRNENFRDQSQKLFQKVQVTLRLKKIIVKPSMPPLKLCETLLGIIAVEDSSYEGQSKRSRLIVAGLTPGGIAIKSELLRLGDILIKIDGKDVYSENISQELSKLSLPKKVTLEIERKISDSRESFTRMSIPPPLKDKSFMLKLIKPGLDHLETNEVSTLETYAILYLRNSSNATSSSSDGIVYQYPISNSLFSLSGMFITIAHLITEITNSILRSSSLVINNKIIRVNYYEERNDLLLLVLPQQSVSSEVAESLILNVARLIKWQFFSLARAFTEKENKKTLDHFFKLFFYSVLSKNKNLKQSNFFECLGGIPRLNLGIELLEKLDNLLSELESGDFGDITEAFFDTKRLYLITGSALFYKGVLCTSHLPKEDLMDCYLYSQYFQLLNLTTENDVGQIIVWREVYPSRQQNLLQDVTATNFDFREEDGRWFILVVALKNCLICVLLEVGGCTARAGNHPPPDPFYVDQVRNVLLRMTETEITSQIEKEIENQNLVELADPSAVLNKMKESTSKLRLLRHPAQLAQNRSLSKQMLNRKETLGKYSISHSSLLSSPEKKFQEHGGMNSKKLTPYHGDLEKQSLLARNSPPEDFDADHSLSQHANDSFSSVLYGKNGTPQQASSSCSDAESRTSSENDIYRGLKSRRILSGSFDLSSLRTDLDDIESESLADSPKLLSGPDVNLFHYIHLNPGEGVLICPHDRETDTWYSLRSQITSSFQKCVGNIHRIFQTSIKNKDSARLKDASKFADHSLPPIKEHGVLFHITPAELINANSQAKKMASTLAFWVIGRLFMMPEPKEVYVCFQDSTAQNLVELAFKLSFGNLY